MRNGPTQPLQPNLSRMLRRALRAHERGEFDKAERFYNAVLHSDVDNLDALHGLGLINYRRGRLEAALLASQAQQVKQSNSPGDLPKIQGQPTGQ